jgi:hypothetical protein
MPVSQYWKYENNQLTQCQKSNCSFELNVPKSLSNILAQFYKMGVQIDPEKKGFTKTTYILKGSQSLATTNLSQANPFSTPKATQASSVGFFDTHGENNQELVSDLFSPYWDTATACKKASAEYPENLPKLCNNKNSEEKIQGVNQMIFAGGSSTLKYLASKPNGPSSAAFYGNYLVLEGPEMKTAYNGPKSGYSLVLPAGSQYATTVVLDSISGTSNIRKAVKHLENPSAKANVLSIISQSAKGRSSIDYGAMSGQRWLLLTTLASGKIKSQGQNSQPKILSNLSNSIKSMINACLAMSYNSISSGQKCYKQ